MLLWWLHGAAFAVGSGLLAQFCKCYYRCVSALMLQLMTHRGNGDQNSDPLLLFLDFDLIMNVVGGYTAFLLDSNSGYSELKGLRSNSAAPEAIAAQEERSALMTRMSEDLRSCLSSVGGLQSLVQDIAPALFRASDVEVRQNTTALVVFQTWGDTFDVHAAPRTGSCSCCLWSYEVQKMVLRVRTSRNSNESVEQTKLGVLFCGMACHFFPNLSTFSHCFYSGRQSCLCCIFSNGRQVVSLQCFASTGAQALSSSLVLSSTICHYFA